MKPKNITTIKMLFIGAQSLTLITGVFLTVIFLYYHYMKNYSESWMKNLDQIVYLAAHHLKTNSELVQGSDGADFLFYVIDQKDGMYVFEQGKRSLEEENLWERYSRKLIYEMQKQRQGWIFYPEKKPWQINASQRVIRYVPIDELDWIVALETHKKSDLSLLKEFFNPGLFFLVFVIISGGISLFWFMTDTGFKVLHKLISDSIESSLLDLSNEDLLRGGLRPNQERQSVSPDKLVKELPATVEPLETFMEQPPLGKFHSPPPLPQASMFPETQKSPFPMPAQDEPSPLSAGQSQNQPSPAVPAPKMEEKTIDHPEPSVFHDMTINLQNIKSSVLKKIITDFRNNRK